MSEPHHPTSIAPSEPPNAPTDAPEDFEPQPWSPIRRAVLLDASRAYRGELLVDVAGQRLRVRAPLFRIDPTVQLGDTVTLLAFDDGAVSVFPAEAQ